MSLTGTKTCWKLYFLGFRSRPFCTFDNKRPTKTNRNRMCLQGKEKKTMTNLVNASWKSSIVHLKCLFCANVWCFNVCQSFPKRVIKSLEKDRDDNWIFLLTKYYVKRFLSFVNVVNSYVTNNRCWLHSMSVRNASNLSISNVFFPPNDVSNHQ